MPAPRAEAKFLRQARRGTVFWRSQRQVAFAAAALMVAGSAYQLYRTWREPSGVPYLDLFRVLAVLGLAVAAAVWQIHADLMLGAASHLEQAAGQSPPGRP